MGAPRPCGVAMLRAGDSVQEVPSEAMATIVALRAELAAACVLLHETLRPGAYGHRSTLAARIEAYLDPEREGRASVR